MNVDRVVGVLQAHNAKGEPCGIRLMMTDLNPEYRALLEEAEETKTGLISAYNEENIKVRNLVAERDALKANLDEAMRLLLEAPVIDAIEVLQEAGPSLVPDTLANWTEEVAALGERIGK